MPILLAATASAESSVGGLSGTISSLIGLTQAKFMSINWASPSWDLFIVLFFILAFFLYGMSLGRNRIIVILVSIYMALAIANNTFGNQPSDWRIKFLNWPEFQIGFFYGLLVIIFFLFSRTGLRKTFDDMAEGKIHQVLIFSILHVGLLVSITISFLPSESLNYLAPITRTIFVSEIGRPFWLIAPIFGLVTLLPKKDK